MNLNGRRPSGDARRRAARFGLGRAVASAPAMLGSLLLLMVVSSAAGRWWALCLLAWAATAAALTSRVGERALVRAVFGVHRPSPAQSAALKPAWSMASRVTGIAAGDVELYVRNAREPNAFAAGGRSIAVTSRIVEDCATGRLPQDQLVAVFVHELGHHATGATRPLWLMSCLSAPWRLASKLLIDLASAVAGRRPRRGVAVVVVAGLAVAATRAAQQGQWMAGGVLVFIGLAAVPCPIADAAISRRVEYAADRFAADHGLAIELAAALRVLDDGQPAPYSWSRLRSSHPTTEQRIRALQAAAGGLAPG